MGPYHGIIFGGSEKEMFDDSMYGFIRQPAPYKLRTLAKKHGYNIKAIDFTQAFSRDQLRQTLENLVNKDTLFIGFSAALYHPHSEFIYATYWTIFDFLLHSKYKPQIIMGGFRTYFKHNDWMEWDWLFTGYVDYDFIQWLHYLSGKPSDIKWKNLMGYKWIDGDSNAKNFDKGIIDNIEVEWLEEDHIQPYETLPIEISRGCRFACDFCEYPMLRSKQGNFDGIRETLGRQISANKENWGVTNYWFDDFTFNSHQGKLDLIDDVNKDTGINIKFSTFIRPELLVRWPDQQQQLVEQGLEGAGFGMETLSKTPQVRSSISKGGDIDKINDAAEYMNRISNKKTSFLYLMMLGLPGQTLEDMEYDHTFIRDADWIDTWNFSAVRFSHKNSENYNATISKITQNPENYGYVSDNVNATNILNSKNKSEDRFNWQNPHTNFLEVMELETRWIAEDRPITKVGGFNSQYLRSLNYDVDKHIGRVSWKDLDIDPLMADCQKRINRYIAAVLSEKVTT